MVLMEKRDSRNKGPLIALFLFLSFILGIGFWAWNVDRREREGSARIILETPDVVEAKPAPSSSPAPSPPITPSPSPTPNPLPSDPAPAANTQPQQSISPPTQSAPTPTPATPVSPKPILKSPDQALLQPGPFGPLPRIAPDGRAPWQVYARPFDAAEPKPKIAILVGDLGLSVPASNAAIDRLPPEVTLAFAPYAEDLQSWIAKARTIGHEVILQVPMEPIDYPVNNPGPHALMLSAGIKENLNRLEWMLSRVQGYVGVTNYMGSKFTTSASDMRPILQQIRDRGLLFVDSKSSPQSLGPQIARELRIPRATNNRFIDNEASRTAIDARLEELERVAREAGIAVGIGYPYPVTIERIAAWAAGLKAKGLVLAPVSAIVERP